MDPGAHLGVIRHIQVNIAFAMIAIIDFKSIFM